MRDKLIPIFLTLCFAGTLPAVSVSPVDFDKIEHWSGEGENRAALVIQFNSKRDNRAHVWGYRWPAGETRTGEDMFRAVCGNSTELCLLTQFTGQYGSTVDGVGYSSTGDVENLLRCVTFDFDEAQQSRFVNFKYFGEPTELDYGQRGYPGADTPVMCAEAVTQAIEDGSHVIQHPIDYKKYGYPAYDYDCWHLDKDAVEYDPKFQWESAWYSGYWSYYLGSPGSEVYVYSGMGYSGRQLSDGCVDGWSFCLFDEPKVGGIGEGVPPYTDEAKLDYRPADYESSAKKEINAVEPVDILPEYYSLQGIRLQSAPPSGIYIERRGNVVRKIMK